MDDLLFSYAEPTDPLPKRLLIRAIERSTGQPRLKRLYFENQRHPVPGESFWKAAVRRLELDVRFDREALSRIPATGPVVIVANHPYGVLDGIVIAWLIEKVRPDFKIMTNAALMRAPEARPFLLPVDFTGTEEAKATNLRSRKSAREHLAAGGCVIVFPAGGVSTSPDPLGRKVAVDSPWQPFTVALAQHARAAIVPIWFHGQNSRAFQIASHIGLTLRLALLFKEVNDRIGTRLDVSIGAPIGWGLLEDVTDRRKLAARLQAITERVGGGAVRGRTISDAPERGRGEIATDPLATFLSGFGVDTARRRPPILARVTRRLRRA